MAPTYTLYYHAGFTGRIEPVLTLLADAGVQYELSREPLSAPALHLRALRRAGR